MVLGVVVNTEDVTVVGCAAGFVGEDVVGFGDERKGVRGGWIGAIHVGVVGFGEGVERSCLLVS